MNKYVEAEGMKAFKDGNLSNPYNEGSSKAKSWEWGFNKAYFDNLEKVMEREKRQALKERTNETRGRG